jgi:hypothetical protein
MTTDITAPFKQHFKRPRDIPQHGMGRLKNARSRFGRAAFIVAPTSAKREEQQ